MLKKILAFICKICPFCVVARKFPDNKFAKKLKKAEKSCPACKAYYEIYQQ